MYLQTQDNKSWHYIKEIFIGQGDKLYYGYAQTAKGYFTITKGFKTEKFAERKVKEILNDRIIKEIISD